MRLTMEVNNVSIDPRDMQNRNYFLEQEGEPYPDRELPPDVAEGLVYIECNKRTNLSCIAALELDVLDTIGG